MTRSVFQGNGCGKIGYTNCGSNQNAILKVAHTEFDKASSGQSKHAEFQYQDNDKLELKGKGVLKFDYFQDYDCNGK